MNKKIISATVVFSFCTILLFSVLLIQRKTLSASDGKRDQSKNIEESWGEFKKSDFTDEEYMKTVEYTRDEFGSLSDLCTILVRNSDLPDARQMTSSEVFVALGSINENVLIKTQLRGDEIRSVGSLDWEHYALGNRNTLVFMEGYMLIKNNRIAELELELLKAKKADPNKIKEAKNKLTKSRMQIEQFAKKYYGWSD